MKVKKEILFLISGVFWLIAGVNVFLIGLKSYKNEGTLFHLFISLLVFSLFWFKVFNKLTKKHTKRILNYPKFTSALNFFDKKSYIIMFCMITLGIVMRNFMPIKCVAMFYSGLGGSLLLAGIILFTNYKKTF